MESCFRNVLSADLNRQGERPTQHWLYGFRATKARIANGHIHRGCDRVRLHVQTQKPLKRCYGLSVVDSRYFHSGSGSLSTRSPANSKLSNRLRSEHNTFLRAQFFFKIFFAILLIFTFRAFSTFFVIDNWEMRHKAVVCISLFSVLPRHQFFKIHTLVFFSSISFRPQSRRYLSGSIKRTQCKSLLPFFCFGT